MPMKKDPQGGGTEADGTKSGTYCSYCYQNGKFMGPENMTAKEMQAFCKNKLKEMGWPGFLAAFFTMGIPKLKRWQNK
jgi:hypothetical protein